MLRQRSQMLTCHSLPWEDPAAAAHIRHCMRTREVGIRWLIAYLGTFGCNFFRPSKTNSMWHFFELRCVFSTNLYVVTCIFCVKTSDFGMYEYMSNSTKTINKITRIHGGLTHILYSRNTSRDWICTQVFIVFSTTHRRPLNSLPLSMVPPGTFSCCQISDDFEFEFWTITRSYWGR